MKKVVLAYSGGLDTSYCAVHLSSDLKLEVHAVLVNTGGFTEQEIKDIEDRAYSLGVTSFKAIEAVSAYYEKVVKYLIFGNVLKNNTYPLSVSAERVVQALEIVDYANQIKAEYIAHGSTGAGNDQVRFDLIFNTLAPQIEIITPIRDQGLSRTEEITYLESKGVNMSWEQAKYSINKGLWGTSVGGAETLTSHQALPEEAYPSQLKTEGETRITLQFKNGEPSALNGKEMNAVQLITELSELASNYAIGRDIHVGDTILGIKGRVGFEAGASMIILKAHHLLEKHVLSKWQMQHKDYLANWYGTHLHEGLYLDPVMRDIEAMLESTQSNVTGEVIIKLNPYRFELEGITSDNDLMQSRFGAYGEENKGWTSEDTRGFIKIYGTQSRIYNQIHDLV